ncbi:MAG: hypothetical protein NC086_08385 [Alistipes sp.]|nr:hypothetical protein [Alistipes sp.]
MAAIELDEAFYKEEERQGYLVSSQMKHIWAVELDLWKEFDDVCRKHMD